MTAVLAVVHSRKQEQSGKTCCGCPILGCQIVVILYRVAHREHRIALIVIHDGLPVIGLEDIEFFRGPFHIANSDCAIRARAFSLLNGDGASRAGHSRSAILSAPSLANLPFRGGESAPSQQRRGTSASTVRFAQTVLGIAWELLVVDHEARSQPGATRPDRSISGGYGFNSGSKCVILPLGNDEAVAGRTAVIRSVTSETVGVRSVDRAIHGTRYGQAHVLAADRTTNVFQQAPPDHRTRHPFQQRPYPRPRCLN